MKPIQDATGLVDLKVKQMARIRRGKYKGELGTIASIERLPNEARVKLQMADGTNVRMSNRSIEVVL